MSAKVATILTDTPEARAWTCYAQARPYAVSSAPAVKRYIWNTVNLRHSGQGDYRE
jgi:hypothetical protein